MDADERALLAAIIANPEEDTPRLVYADWLQEHDQPDRAEYLRLSIQLANLRYGEPDFEAREAQLREQLQTFEKQANEVWSEAFVALFHRNRGASFHFERGFVYRVWCSPKYFLDNADAMFRAAPLRALGPRNLTPTTAKRLVNSPHFRRLKGIKPLNPAGALALLGCPSVEIDTFDCAQFLYFSNGEWDHAAVRAAGHAGLKALRHLDFENCGLGDPAGQALADSPHLDPAVLNLLVNTFTEPVKQALRKRYGPRVWLDPQDRTGTRRRIF